MYSTGLAKAGSTRRASIKRGLTGAIATRLVVGAAAAAGLFGLVTATPASARPAADMPTVQIERLPPEARTTYDLILAGGPFPYSKDGTVFLNRERLLPPQARGWYREYTVKTPRSRDRGARRIVCGGKPPTAPAACYYTGDHYASFSRIATAP